MIKCGGKTNNEKTFKISSVCEQFQQSSGSHCSRRWQLKAAERDGKIDRQQRNNAYDKWQLKTNSHARIKQ